MARSTRTIDQTDGYFESEYEVELEQWYRRRFRNLCIALLAILCGFWLLAGISWSLLAGQPGTEISEVIGSQEIYQTAVGVLLILIVLWFLMVVRPQLETKDQLIRSATRLVMALSLTAVCANLVLPFLGGGESNANTLELFFWHFTACLILPWTPWQSLKAIGPAYLLWATQLLGFETSRILISEQSEDRILLSISVFVVMLALVTMIFLPGMFICWLRLRRHGRRFRVDMIGRQFLSMRRELQQARRIHDALFPERTEDERTRFDFEYRPQTDIGGDFVWHEQDGSVVRVVLIDVTGHGLTAAMTVNRIHGEIQRIRGEHPDCDPARMMSLIDRYFVLTLAPHNVYATGFAFELDLDSGLLKWVNAGHPPGFVLSPVKEPVDLSSTTIMLGALGVDDFEPDQQEMNVTPGDTIVAYTDGVLEARDTKGRMLGLENLRQLVRGGGREKDWPARIMRFVTNHARGAFEDDALVVSLEYLPPTSQDAEAPVGHDEASRG